MLLISGVSHVPTLSSAPTVAGYAAELAALVRTGGQHLEHFVLARGQFEWQPLAHRGSEAITAERYIAGNYGLFFFVLLNNIFATLPFLQFPTFSRAGLVYGLVLISWLVYNIAGIKDARGVPEQRDLPSPPGREGGLAIAVVAGQGAHGQRQVGQCARGRAVAVVVAAALRVVPERRPLGLALRHVVVLPLEQEPLAGDRREPPVGRGDVDQWKSAHAADTDARTLADALQGADVFLGLSAAGALKAEMVAGMAKEPIIFAMANPDPEIWPPDAKAVRPDAIIATGRSDYPNQVNNVLGFPYIFRGALDVRARTINEDMKKAAVTALAIAGCATPLPPIRWEARRWSRCYGPTGCWPAA